MTAHRLRPAVENRRQEVPGRPWCPGRLQVRRWCRATAQDQRMRSPPTETPQGTASPSPRLSQVSFPLRVPNAPDPLRGVSGKPRASPSLPPSGDCRGLLEPISRLLQQDSTVPLDPGEEAPSRMRSQGSSLERIIGRHDTTAREKSSRGVKPILRRVLILSRSALRLRTDRSCSPMSIVLQGKAKEDPLETREWRRPADAERAAGPRRCDTRQEFFERGRPPGGGTEPVACQEERAHRRVSTRAPVGDSMRPGNRGTTSWRSSGGRLCRSGKGRLAKTVRPRRDFREGLGNRPQRPASNGGGSSETGR